MAQTIAIVDYGMGNLRSVYQAFHHVAPSDNVLIAHQPEEIRSADRVVLPGQGAMPDCMKHLQESGLLEALLEASKTKPLLGVCVGEQMLFDKSAEVRANGNDQWTSCLGLIPGEVRRFDLLGKKQSDGSAYKVPHMGWNQVQQVQAHPIWDGIPDNSSCHAHRPPEQQPPGGTRAGRTGTGFHADAGKGHARRAFRGGGPAAG